MELCRFFLSIKRPTSLGICTAKQTLPPRLCAKISAGESGKSSATQENSFYLRCCIYERIDKVKLRFSLNKQLYRLSPSRYVTTQNSRRRPIQKYLYQFSPLCTKFHAQKFRRTKRQANASAKAKRHANSVCGFKCVLRQKTRKIFILRSRTLRGNRAGGGFVFQNHRRKGVF